MKDKTKFRLILSVILILAILVVLKGSMYTINERELAVILQLGRPVATRTEPGLYFKVPLIQEVRRVPGTLQLWETTEEIVDLPTADGKKIEVSAWAVWRITDPKQFIQILKTTDGATDAVRVRTRAAIRDVITAHNLSEVVRNTPRNLTYTFKFELPDMDQLDDEALDETPEIPKLKEQDRGEVVSIKLGREKLLGMIRDNVTARLKGADATNQPDRGIELVDIGISNIGFVASVRQAAFERQKAFMVSIAAGYRNMGELKKQQILNSTQAEVERIQGDGEGESQRIRGEIDAEIIQQYAKAIQETGDFYNFIRTLEVYQAGMQGKTQLILSTDTEFLKMLKQIPLQENPIHNNNRPE